MDEIIDGIEYQWSFELIIEENNQVYNIFQMDTWAVKARLPDGVFRIRILPPGTASRLRHVSPREQQEYKEHVQQQVREQTEMVVIEHG